MLVLFCGNVLCDGVGEPRLFFRLPVVRQRKVDVGGKRLLPTGKLQEDDVPFEPITASTIQCAIG
jgi:hypothetical protein